MIVDKIYYVMVKNRGFYVLTNQQKGKNKNCGGGDTVQLRYTENN
jgi:hypothetical protein